ncbi:unnamed protein product [Amoebophrya sp. A25]|nr:unnamed protein product [Amoebophrya sp. A25]|eukprot:GSA25T00007137001.1
MGKHGSKKAYRVAEADLSVRPKQIEDEYEPGKMMQQWEKIPWRGVAIMVATWCADSAIQYWVIEGDSKRVIRLKVLGEDGATYSATMTLTWYRRSKKLQLQGGVKASKIVCMIDHFFGHYYGPSPHLPVEYPYRVKLDDVWKQNNELTEAQVEEEEEWLPSFRDGRVVMPTDHVTKVAARGTREQQKALADREKEQALKDMQTRIQLQRMNQWDCEGTDAASTIVDADQGLLLENGTMWDPTEDDDVEGSTIASAAAPTYAIQAPSSSSASTATSCPTLGGVQMGAQMPYWPQQQAQYAWPGLSANPMMDPHLMQMHMQLQQQQMMWNNWQASSCYGGMPGDNQEYATQLQNMMLQQPGEHDPLKSGAKPPTREGVGSKKHSVEVIAMKRHLSQQEECCDRSNSAAHTGITATSAFKRPAPTVGRMQSSRLQSKDDASAAGDARWEDEEFSYEQYVQFMKNQKTATAQNTGRERSSPYGTSKGCGKIGAQEKGAVVRGKQSKNSDRRKSPQSGPQSTTVASASKGQKNLRVKGKNWAPMSKGYGPARNAASSSSSTSASHSKASGSRR